MTEPVELLQALGFSDYEARAYITLLQQSPLNGYELAKLSGLPRANIYAVLDKLAARAAVVRLDTPDGARYEPVAPAELLQRLGTHFQGTLQAAQGALEELAGPPAYDAIGNARGYPVVLEHARALLATAEEGLLIALWPEEARALAADLAQAQVRGVTVTTLCLAGCAQECGHCRGAIYRYPVGSDLGRRWLVLVADGREILAGEIGPGEAALAVRTQQRFLIELMTRYIQDSIALAAVLDDLGPQLPALLRPATRAILAAIGSAAAGGWLEQMHQRLQRPAGRPPSARKEGAEPGY